MRFEQWLHQSSATNSLQTSPMDGFSISERYLMPNISVSFRRVSKCIYRICIIDGVDVFVSMNVRHQLVEAKSNHDDAFSNEMKNVWKWKNLLQKLWLLSQLEVDWNFCRCLNVIIMASKLLVQLQLQTKYFLILDQMTSRTIITRSCWRYEF